MPDEASPRQGPVTPPGGPIPLSALDRAAAARRLGAPPAASFAILLRAAGIPVTASSLGRYLGITGQGAGKALSWIEEQAATPAAEDAWLAAAKASQVARDETGGFARRGDRPKPPVSSEGFDETGGFARPDPRAKPPVSSPSRGETTGFIGETTGFGPPRVRDACSKQAKAKGEEGESRGGEEGTEPKPLVSPEPSDPWEVEPPARRPAVPAIEGRAEWATADPPTTFGPDDRPGEPPSGPDPEAVAACVRYIEDRFVTVNPGQVKRALASGAPPDLIRLAAWITKHQRGRAGVGLLFTILRDDLMPVYQTDGLAGIPWPRPGDGPASDPPPIPATLAEQERASRLEAERARAAAAEAARRILATREEASRPALQAWYRGFAAEHPELKEKLDRRGPAAPFAPAARRAPRPRPVPHLLDPPAEDPATVAARRRELAARLAAAGVPADRLSTG